MRALLALLLVAPWLWARPAREEPRLVLVVCVESLLPEQLKLLAPHFSGPCGTGFNLTNGLEVSFLP